MRRSKSARRGFTLVELLAVVAILTLLIMLLMPMLGHAVGLAQRASCMNNYRELGAAFKGYAAAHLERNPRSAYVFMSKYAPAFDPGNPSEFCRDVEYANAGWSELSVDHMDMLETEYFQTMLAPSSPLANWSALPRIAFWQPMTQADTATRKHQIACPSLVASPLNYCFREKFTCLDFIGGLSAWYGDDSNVPLEGPYGVKVNPAPLVPGWQFYYGDPNWTPIYCLGTRAEQYPNPSGQFAVWESDYANDTAAAGNMGWLPGATDGSVTKGAYCVGSDTVSGRGPTTDTADGGTFHFRHANLTANFLYVDGHVEYKSPSDQVLGLNLYSYIRTW